MTNLENKVNENKETAPSLEKKDFIPIYGLYRLLGSGRYNIGENGIHKDYFSHAMILSAYNALIFLGAADLYKYLTQ